MKKAVVICILLLLLSSTLAAAQTAAPVIDAKNVSTVHEVARTWRGVINDIAVTSDESALAVGASTGVYVYDLKDRSKPVTSFPVDGTVVRCVAFDSTGTNIAAGTEDGKVYIFNTYTGEKRAVIDASTSKINDVMFTYSPFSVLAAGDDHLITVWSMSDFSRLNSLSGHSGAVSQLASADDGKTIVSIDSGSLHFWDNASFFPRHVLNLNGLGGVRALAFNPTKPLAVAVAVGSDLDLDSDLSAQGGDTSLPQTTAIAALAYSADGRLLASADDTTITLRDPDSGKALQELEQGGYIRSLAFSPDGARLYSAGNAAVAIWDTATGKRRETIYDQFGLIDGLSFSPDGKLLAVADYLNPTVTIFDAATLEQVAELRQGDTGGIDAVTFSPDGKLLASAGSADNNAITLRDATTFKPVKTLDNQTDTVRKLSFSPNSTALFAVTSFFDSTGNQTPAANSDVADLWDLATGTLIHEWQPAPGSGIWSGLFTPDGTTLVTGTDDGYIRLWNASSGQKQADVKVDFTPYGLAMNAGETLLLYSSGNDTNFLTINSPGPFTPMPGYVSATSSDGVFTPDGKIAAVRINDNDIRLFDFDTKAEAAVLKGHTDSVQTLVFSPDGTRLASAGSDGTIRLWAAGAS